MFSFFLVVSTLFVSFPSPAAVNCEAEYTELREATRTGKQAEIKKKKDNVVVCEQKRMKDIGDCKSVIDDFKKTVARAKADCEKFDLNSTPDTGSIACSSSVDKCACLDKTTRPIEKAGDFCSGVNEKTHPFCPQRTDAAAERNAKKIETAENRIEKLRDKVNRYEDESDKAENNAADKAREAKTALRKAEADHTQAINEAQSAMTQAQNQIYQSMNGIQEKIYTAQQSVTDTALKDSAAYTNFQEQDLKIEMGCTTQATQAVSAMQSEAIVAMKSGTYNRGDQGDIFRQVGLTDRQAWQKQAALRKRWCMDSELTHASKTSNERAYQESLKGNAEARRQAQKQVEMLRQQMGQLMSADGSCAGQAANGAVIQTQYCQNIAEVKRKTTAADQALAAAKADAREQEVAAAKATEKSKGNKDKQIGDAKAQLADEEANLRALREKEKAFDTYPSAGSHGQEAKDLNLDFIQLTDRAGWVNRCCQVSKENSITQSEECSRARGFLEAHNYSVDLKAESTTNNKPTPTQTPASNTTGSGSTRTPTSDVDGDGGTRQ